MPDLKTIHGMLSIERVEIPYETEAQREKAEETNRQLAAFGWRTARIAYDWGMDRYEDTKKAAHDSSPSVRMQCGDLVKIFRTVSEGDVLWQGTIAFDHSVLYNHGIQKDTPAEMWGEMFSRALPARLEREDGVVLFGCLEPFCETGTEGIIWSLHEYGKAGYDGLNCLSPGDRLTVYSSVRDGDIEWEGRMSFGREGVVKTRRAEILRPVHHMTNEAWLDLNFQSRPIILQRK